MAGRHESEGTDQGPAPAGPVDRVPETTEPRTVVPDSTEGGADRGSDEDRYDDDAVEYSAEVDLSEEEGPPGGGSRT
jgi:hypothetical protein